MTADEIIQWLKEKRDDFPKWDDRYEDLDILIDELQEEIENRALNYFTSPSLPEQK